MEQFWDDMSGKELNPQMVRIARQDEMKEFRDHQVYVKVSLAECSQNTGNQPIGCRWVDINKGDENHPEYMSRLVAK